MSHEPPLTALYDIEGRDYKGQVLIPDQSQVEEELTPAKSDLAPVA